ncbi:uncharacterized protein LOC129584650 isoform X2 [Paramacrobiotus metropolitanus]|nr:uncharacterized protein LOC129584650 isoform X2 [Paramacrobiotus metropolitanus]
MVLVYGTPLFFRYFGLEARFSNYGNTVIVKRDNGEWWLGYVQDIDGDLFYINFDSSTAGPSWIHARHIWPHEYFKGGSSVYMGQRVQVAVRNEPGGPFIFRAGRIAYVPLQKYSICWNVNLDEHLSGDHLSNCKCKFVYESQIVMELPLAEELCFYRNNATFVYKKYVIPFKQAYLIRNLDAVSGCIFPAPRPPSKIVRWSVFASRFFVEFGTDFVSFVVAEGRDTIGGQEIIDSEDYLKRKSLLAACESLLAVQPPPGAQRSTQLNYNCHDTNMEGFPINDLPQPILVAVLLHFHARVQGRMHRVCMLWHLMLPDHLVTTNVLVDISVKIDDRDVTQNQLLAFKYMNSLYNDEFNLTMVLDQMITSRTKTLTLVDLTVSGKTEFENRAYITTKVLLAKRIRVPVIIIRNCRNRYGELIKNTATTENYECQNFSKLVDVCDKLLIVNHEFTAGTFFREQALCLEEPQVIPETDRPFVRPYCHDRGSRVVKIDRLLLRSTETIEQHVRLLLLAANNSYPLVNKFIYDKMTCIHKRWLQTLAYPEEWVAVRNFLNL